MYLYNIVTILEPTRSRSSQFLPAPEPSSLAVLLPSGSTPVVAGGVIVWRAGGPAGGRGFGSLLAGLQEG